MEQNDRYLNQTACEPVSLEQDACIYSMALMNQLKFECEYLDQTVYDQMVNIQMRMAVIQTL